MDISLAHKRILITGGTGALGRVLVRRACEENGAVYFTYYSNREEAQRLERLGARGFRLDLTKRAEVDQFKKEMQSCTHELDAIVFNAATVKDHTLQNLTEAEWDEVISVNLSSVYYLTKQLLPLLSSPKFSIGTDLPIEFDGLSVPSLTSDKYSSVVKGGEPKSLDPRLQPEADPPQAEKHAGLPAGQAGMTEDFEPEAAEGIDPEMTKCVSQRKIINVISRVGLRGGFGQANYAAAKGGLIALTKTLALELGQRQILVNAVNPGFMNSKMTEVIPEDVFDQNKQESPLGVISDPETVADFFIYLLSDRFQNVTGQVFHFDSRRI